MATRTRHAMGQGQGFRYLRPDRSVAGHKRRDRRSAATRYVARSGRTSVSERQHEDDGLRSGGAGVVFVEGDEPATRRRHFHRHAAGRGHGRKAVTRLPEGWADDAARNPGPGRATATHGRREVSPPEKQLG